MREKVIKNARLAVQVMEEVHAEAQTSLSLVRQSVMQCELAFSLLGCGNSFEVVSETLTIPQRSISEAAILIEGVTKAVVNTGLLEGHIIKHVIYLITLCDLHFRKGDFKQALSVATRCLCIAKKKEDIMGIARSEKRIDILERHYL